MPEAGDHFEFFKKYKYVFSRLIAKPDFMKVLFNFATSNTGGVIGFKNSIFRALCQNKNLHGGNFFVIPGLVDSNIYKLISKHLNVIPLSDPLDTMVNKIKFYEFQADKILKEFEIDVVINFGDIPIRTKLPQVYYFDWPYAVYRDFRIWRTMPVREILMMGLKLLYMSSRMSYANAVVAQTSTMRARLEEYYQGVNASVVSIGYDSIEYKANDKRLLRMPFDYLFYPTAYYPHKNLEVLVPVAKLIKNNKIPIKIVLTLDGARCGRSQAFLKEVARTGVSDVILTIGRLDRDTLIQVFRSSSGYLTTSLMETYGLPYLEAKLLGVPILTSRTDFAYDVCGEEAIYFDPFSVDSVFKAIREFVESEHSESSCVSPTFSEHKEKTWEEVCSDLILIAKRACGPKKSCP